MRRAFHAKAFGRRIPVAGLTSDALAKMARSPSYRAPAAADVHDPDAVRPPDEKSPPVAFGAKDLVTRDGRVVGLSLSGRSFISNGEALLRAAPVSEVRLVAVQPFMAELARCPHLAAIRRLDLSGNRIGAVGVRELAGSPHLGGLHELVLSGNDLGEEGFAALLAAPWLPQLTTFELADNRLGPHEIEALGAFENLEVLDVSRNPLGVAGAEALARFSRLRQLKASRCGFGAAGATVLFAGSRFESLTDLDLSFNDFGPDGAGAIANAPLPNLLALNLGFNDIEDDGAAALAHASLSTLRTLNLAANRITPVGATALAGSTALASVKEMILAINPLGDAPPRGRYNSPA